MIIKPMPGMIFWHKPRFGDGPGTKWKITAVSRDEVRVERMDGGDSGVDRRYVWEDWAAEGRLGIEYSAEIFIGDLEAKT